MKADLIVTRHQALLRLLQELRIVTNDTQVVTHIESAEMLEDKVVVGNLPLNLAANCKEVWSPVLNVPKELRGKELSFEELKKYFLGLARFKVEYLGPVE
ncbi:MAG: hypothetical protein J7L34_07360 [Thermotogaceae bacterium]|nr:hypothetical protein [Thermotogaceae bacterium]